jgi:hydrogenase nickel incorporation protein HypA/HybF
MHEVSLINQVMNIAVQVAAEENLTRITLIKLIIGDRMCVLPESLEFSFQWMKSGEMWEQAKLDWDRCPGFEFYIAYIEGE